MRAVVHRLSEKQIIPPVRELALYCTLFAIPFSSKANSHSPESLSLEGTEIGNVCSPSVLACYDADVLDPPPLDSFLTYRRRTATSSTATKELVSLIHEEAAPNSFPWSMFIQLNTHHDQGIGAGSFVRLLNNSLAPGDAFAYNTDIYHQSGNGPFGFNLELIRSNNPLGWTEGLHIENSGASAYVGNTALHISGSWTRAIRVNPPGTPFVPRIGMHIEGQTAQGVRVAGARSGILIRNDRLEPTPNSRGIWIKSKQTVGADLGDNSLRLSADVPIILDGKGDVQVVFSSSRKALEFTFRGRVIGYVPLSREERSLACAKPRLLKSGE